MILYILASHTRSNNYENRTLDVFYLHHRRYFRQSAAGVIDLLVASNSHQYLGLLILEVSSDLVDHSISGNTLATTLRRRVNETIHEASVGRHAVNYVERRQDWSVDATEVWPPLENVR